MNISLLNLNIFQKKCILANIEIKFSARIENGLKQLLAIVTENGDIILLYNFGGLPPVLKHIPWFTDSDKTIQSICFDPTATWLLVTTVDVSIYIIPALYIVDPKQKIDCKWSLTDITFFSRHEKTPNVKPLCIIWWQTLDCNQNAILGHVDGTISFVSLTDGQNIGTCQVFNEIKSLHICPDNKSDSVTLLITNVKRQQWRLLLEHRSTGFIWSPECGNKVQTTMEYAYNGLNNGHSEEIKSTRTRLQGLKQMSVDRLTYIKEKLVETRSKKFKVTLHEQKSTGSNSSESSQSDSTIPEKLSHLCETYLCPQFARNRHLFSGYYERKNILTIHGVDVEDTPMYIYKLFPECYEILVTDRFFFIVNEDLNKLFVVNCHYSESKLDGETEFNNEALLSEFCFKNETIQSIYKLSDLNNLKNESSDNDIPQKLQKTFVLARSEAEINIRKPKIDTCVVVTNKNVYKIVLSCPILEKFVRLVSNSIIFNAAEKMAIMFGLNFEQMLEYSGDILLSQDAFVQAISLYRLSKCKILKSVLKFAVTGHCQELLSYITVCLTAANSELSISTKKHLSNLAIMCYTELLLRNSGNVIIKVSTLKRFIIFLRDNDYYDEVLAVNISCQMALWSILSILGKIRCLSFDIIDALSKAMCSNTETDIGSESFHKFISEPIYLQCIISKSLYNKVFLNYIKDNIDNFSTKTLMRLSNSLDPSQPVAWPIISKVFQKHKSHQSSSLDSTLDSLDSEPPDELLQITQDLIETFIYVLIVLINKMTPDPFDINLLNFVEIPTEAEDIERPIPNFIHPKPRILSAGCLHVGLVRNNSLYMWGNTSYGCLGLGPVVNKFSLPQQVEFLNSYQVEVLSVSCGRNHTVVLTNFGVYSWGSNFYGQLGVGSTVLQSSYPSLVETLSVEYIIDISAGQYHTLALNAYGQVFSWGWGVHGQLGHGTICDIFKPKLIKYFSDKVITQISAGHAHSIVLTSEGVVYSFGSNSFGQLGNGTSTKSSIPVQILLNEKIILIATGYFHNLAVATDNKLYMWGASPSILRYQMHNYKRTKKCDKNSDTAVAIDWSSTTPFSIDNTHLFPALLPTDDIEGQIVQVATGGNHSALLTKDGSLYTWGQNIDGQIGNGTQSDVLVPTLVKINPLNTLNNLNAGVNSDANQPLKCSYVSCGGEFTTAIDLSGKVLAWGNNSRAQLGKMSEEEERNSDGKTLMLKTTKRFIRLTKTAQNLNDSPKEIPTIPTLHISYRNHEKQHIIVKNIPYFYPLRKIENNIATYKAKHYESSSDCPFGTEKTEKLFVFGQKTLHFALETYFNFYDTEFLLHKCVAYKNYQAASKISFLDGHFSDSLGFQLTSFKSFMDNSDWQQYVADSTQKLTSPEALVIKTENPCISLNKPPVNSVSVISTSCSLESIKQFNDETFNQGGFEELCGNELILFENKPDDSAKTEDKAPKLDLKMELLNKLEFNKTEVSSESALNIICEDISNLKLNSSNTEVETVNKSQQPIEFSNEVIRKTVVNYVESLDLDIKRDQSVIPNITNSFAIDLMRTNMLKFSPVVLESKSSETNIELPSPKLEENSNIIELASQIVEFYCSRPQILENHILVQNILIKCMQFWLTNNLPIDILESILIKNMDKYFYPLSILLFCKNFNNNLGEGMVKDTETKKTEKSFEFLKQLSTKFCLHLCSMVLQNVNKA